MATQCKSCGAAIPEGAAFCGKCGSEAPAPTFRKAPSRGMMTVIGIMLILIVAGFFLLRAAELIAENDTDESEAGFALTQGSPDVPNQLDSAVVSKAIDLLAGQADMDTLSDTAAVEPSQMYGDYYGSSNVVLILDGETIDDGPDNLLASIDASNVYLEEAYLYCAFYEEANQDINVVYEFDNVNFESTNGRIRAETSYTYDNTVYEIIFNGTVSEKNEERFFRGNCYVHSYFQSEPEVYADFDIEFDTALRYEFNTTELNEE